MRRPPPPVALLAAPAWLGFSPALAGEPAATVTRAAGAHYDEAGGLHRFLFGTGYRELWAAPFEVERLDLERFSGGLVVEEAGGGKQTRTLDFTGADGREWKFRSIDKDPEAVLPYALRDTFAESVVQDQISASYPLAPLVVDGLARAAGVPFVEHRAVVLPDHPRLAGYRREFASMLGILEQNASAEPPVTPGFERFSEVLGTEELEALLDGCPAERVDARAFLRARLLDLVIGDTDRHGDQWEWARDRRSSRFVAVPKDRDLAFVRFDGRLIALARRRDPQLARFGPRYPAPLALEFQARFLDRRHLAPLAWPAWAEAVAELQARLTGAAIHDAVARLPESYRRASGGWLAASLAARRDALPGAARELYLMLAREAEVHGSDEPDQARLLHGRDGSLEVVLASADGPYFRRRFLPDETDEVRVFLKGGDDRTVSERPAGGTPIVIRVVGGRGRDSLVDDAGGTRFYDADGIGRIAPGPGTTLSERRYRVPRDGDGNPRRDWGSERAFLPWLGASRDYGLMLGAAVSRTHFAFRRQPFGHRHTLRAGYATGVRSGIVEYEYEERREGGAPRFQALARVTALELIHYYGPGNETTAAGPSERYDVHRRAYLLAPEYRREWSFVAAALGPVLKYGASEDESGTLLGQQQPYGSGAFGQVGAKLRLTADRRTRRGQRSSGLAASLQASYYPGVLDVEDGFARVEASVTGAISPRLPLEPELALRAGAARVFGRAPFHEAASLGGGDSLRGLPRERYLGDASLYANAELRLSLLRRDGSLVPRVGLLALADLGRVFLAGESSDRWHAGWGFGAWLSVGNPRHVLSVALARSEGDLRFYLTSGFAF